MANNKLPKSWFVKSGSRTKELSLFRTEVIAYINREYKTVYSGDTETYYGVHNGTPRFEELERNIDGLDTTVLTLEEFIKLKNEVVQDPNPLGYSCPKDLFEGEIKEGAVYVKSKQDPRFYHPYLGHRVGDYRIPKEIVETWEPVYTLEKPKVEFQIEAVSTRNGRKVIVKCIIQKDSQVIEFYHPDNPRKTRKVLIDSLIATLSVFDKFPYQCPTIEGINPIIEAFNLGCSTFKVEDIRTVIKKYKEVNK
jgi:hypothetical protein